MTERKVAVVWLNEYNIYECFVGTKKPSYNPITSYYEHTRRQTPRRRQSRDHRQEEDLCPICLRNFVAYCIAPELTPREDTVSVSTSCLHRFHYDCIREWLKASPSCPVCRSSLFVHPSMLKEEVPGPLL